MLRRANLAVLLLGCLLHASAAAYQPTLWKLSSAGNTVYLLGSIHLGLPDMYPLPKAIEDAFDASSVLLIETYAGPSNHADDTVLEEILKERGLYPRHDSLWNHISKETRRRLTGKK